MSSRSSSRWSDSDELLPKSSGLYQKALVSAFAKLSEKIVPPYPSLLDASLTPEYFLPYLADDRDVQTWVLEDVDAQRKMIDGRWRDLSLAGTPASVISALRSLGVSSSLEEHSDFKFSVSVTYSEKFQSTFQDLIKRTVDEYKPARSEFSINLIRPQSIEVKLRLSFRPVVYKSLSLVVK